MRRNGTHPHSAGLSRRARWSEDSADKTHDLVISVLCPAYRGFQFLARQAVCQNCIARCRNGNDLGRSQRGSLIPSTLWTRATGAPHRLRFVVARERQIHRRIRRVIHHLGAVAAQVITTSCPRSLSAHRNNSQHAHEQKTVVRQ